MKGLERIRYTTSHPKDMSDDLIEAHGQCNKLMPYLHLPVQSGSSKILKQMNRKHDIKDYLLIIEKLKKKRSGIKFSSDFIIAYPNETKEDFEQTLFLMDNVKFINSYSFTYSPRPGTPSFSLDTIDKKIAKDRLQIFQKLANKIKVNYRNSILNQVTTVLFENKVRGQDKYFGRDEYSNSVIVSSRENLIGKVLKIRINEFNQNTLFGDLLYKKNNVAA